VDAVRSQALADLWLALLTVAMFGIDAIGGVIHPIWTDRRASLAPELGEEVVSATLSVR